MHRNPLRADLLRIAYLSCLNDFKAEAIRGPHVLVAVSGHITRSVLPAFQARLLPF